MDKKAILKIVGFLIVPFLVMIVAMFFLYPTINKDKYEEITNTINEQREDAAFEETPIPVDSSDVVNDGIDTDDDNLVVQASSSSTELDSTSIYNFEQWQSRERQLFGIIDSLYIEITRLEAQLDSINQKEEPELDATEFAARVKSLLNLEEDELAPILEKMNQEQLKRLYMGGGTLQREKILKSLKSEEAAELMMEIMQ